MCGQDIRCIAWVTVAIAALVSTAPAQAQVFGGFAPHQDYACGGQPRQVRAADFNNDGFLDLVTANASQSGNGNSVSILLGNGDATFAAPVDYPTGALTQSVLALDLNGDGNIDLTAFNGNDPSISVLYGNGDGTFVTHQTFFFCNVDPNVCGAGMVHTMADYDGDGDVDIAAAVLTPNLILYFPNDGDGTFSSVQVVGQSSGDFVFYTDLEPGDFDGDGDVDLIAVSAQQYLQVFLNNGDGAFAAPLEFTTAAGLFSSPFADLNGDGILDLIIAKWLASPGGYIRVAMGNGDGTFGTQQSYNVASAYGPTPTDIDGDGDIDLVVPNFIASAGTISVLLNAGPELDYALEAPQSFAVGGGNPNNAIAVDLNNDLVPDIVTANRNGNNVSVLMNLSTFPTAVALQSFEGTTGPRGEIALSWSTSSEADHVGFNVYRRAGSADSFERLTRSLVLGEGSYEFVDRSVESGVTYDYELGAVDRRGREERLGFVTVTAGAWSGPNTLFSNYPNPFAGATELSFALPVAAEVRLAIFDAQGRMVRRLVAGERGAGLHAVPWDGRDDAGREVAGGFYFSRLEVAGATYTGKLQRTR